jgi:type III restriction enzyme
MKLHFEPNLDYQHAAIESVCDLFRGQEICRTEFTVTQDFGRQMALTGMESDLGIGNRLQLLDDEIVANLNDIQLRNGLAPSGTLASGDFTVEMETGTGKTYVYLRTVFELNKRYGFTKFVIVVPSVAIKEGVYKTLQITEDHFRTLYANVPFEYFLYDSSKLGQVRNFATSPHIQIMVVTVGAINKKDVNNLYKDSEKTGGEKPIDLIKATRPVLIVDEPQSVDGGLEGQGKEALGAMNPLCTLRYSATHVDKHHMLYRLDAVDAYERKLVKQIEVASLEVEGGHNKAYIKLLDTSNKRGKFTAQVELDVQRGAHVRRETVTVQPGDDLEQITGRAVYADCLVQNIGCKKGDEYLELSHLEKPLRIGEAVGDVDADAMKRLMIRRTIEEHLDKEIRLAPHGIKVLSLFFIDTVEHYRRYGEHGAEKGKYALMFEEEYRKAAARPKYRGLFKGIDLNPTPPRFTMVTSRSTRRAPGRRRN